MSKVLMTVGVPGSGKSYFIKNYIDNNPVEYVICSADHYFENLAQQKKEQLKAENNPEADKVPNHLFDFSKLHAAHISCQQKFMNALKSEIPLIIVDNTNITKKDRDFYVKKAIEHLYEVELKVFPKDEKSVQIAANRNQHNIPPEKVIQRAQAQDLDAGTYKVSLDPTDPSNRKLKMVKILEASSFIRSIKPLSTPSGRDNAFVKHPKFPEKEYRDSTFLKVGQPTDIIPTVDVTTSSAPMASNDPRTIVFKELSDDIDKIKAKIEMLKMMYTEETDSEISRALDDANESLEVSKHHLVDVVNDLMLGDMNKSSQMF